MHQCFQSPAHNYNVYSTQQAIGKNLTVSKPDLMRRYLGFSPAAFKGKKQQDKRRTRDQSEGINLRKNDKS